MSSAFSGQGVVPGAGSQLIGHGFGELQLAPPEVQQQLAGKPAFFDTNTGIYFDGQQAFVYVADLAQQQQPLQSSGAEAQPYANLSTATAVEGEHVFLGNGTVGNLEEHRNAVSSAYVLDG
ncbi:hypothetical protein M3Y94_00631300 [Aphelenchoides besseyi]|nr:hypothetical protein M3Y94_00631300 [Aphelenchoides besseyi]KAI6230932.1 hypothetical protein M3Y95_00328200 [Aphelenchoides besseyi]